MVHREAGLKHSDHRPWHAPAGRSDKLRGPLRCDQAFQAAGDFEPECFAKLVGAAETTWDGDPTRIRQTYVQLKKALGLATRPIHYLAIPPRACSGSVVQGLAKGRFCADNAGASSSRKTLRP